MSAALLPGLLPLVPGAKVRVVSGFAAGTEGVFLWFHKEPAPSGVAASVCPSRVVTDGIERKIPKKLMAEDVFRMIVLTECLEVVA